ncbi:MAG: N-6 DNA methylase [Thermoguttaceae bacterium]|nr:N-6 DNA methylase [Thermoguttaceae bacterium]
MAKRRLKRTTKSKEEKSIEQTIWDEANKLRGKVEPSEYKHVVLSLIFLKYANDRFDAHREQMIANGQQLFLELRPFYASDNVFYVPECSRWAFIMASKSQPDIAIRIDTALHELEKENPALKDALPDNYFSRLRMDSDGLSSLLDDIDVLKLELDGDKDLFGRVYEYCLREFALLEGKSKGEFYTPRTVVALLCELIEPYSGIVYDGACGSGGMFVQSMRFVDEHKGNRLNVSIYGQEYTDATRRLAKMNLAIRGISANLGAEAADTFKKDQHKDLKADFSLENPPFNQREWREENQLNDDPRWEGYPTPPTENANYAWLLNTLSKLNQNGVGVVLLANGAMSAGSEQYDIRKRMIENDVIEAIIVLPNRMFYTTDISVTVWVLNRNKKSRIEKRPSGKVTFRDRSNEVLFMDLRQMGHPYEKKYIEFTEEDRNIVTQKFKVWRLEDQTETYRNQDGFCYSATKEEVVENDYCLTPSRYIAFDEDNEENGDVDFDLQMKQLQRELKELMAKEQETKEALMKVMEGLGYGIS